MALNPQSMSSFWEFLYFWKNHKKCKKHTFYAILSIKALSEVPTFPPGGKHSQKMHFLGILCELSENYPRGRRRRRRRRRRKNFPACPDPYPNAPRDEISRKGKPLTLIYIYIYMYTYIYVCISMYRYVFFVYKYVFFVYKYVFFVYKYV